MFTSCELLSLIDPCMVFNSGNPGQNYIPRNETNGAAIVTIVTILVTMVIVAKIFVIIILFAGNEMIT